MKQSYYHIKYFNYVKICYHIPDGKLETLQPFFILFALLLISINKFAIVFISNSIVSSLPISSINVMIYDRLLEEQSIFSQFYDESTRDSILIMLNNVNDYHIEYSILAFLVKPWVTWLAQCAEILLCFSLFYWRHHILINEINCMTNNTSSHILRQWYN